MANENPIPQALRDAKRWVCWAHRDGRKPPVDRDGRMMAGWNEESSWLTYQTAMAWAFDPSKAEDFGVGFVLGDGFGGLDLDSCRDPKSGDLDPKAHEFLAAFPGAYVEVSPSGEGVKLFGRSETGGFLEWNAKSGAVEIKPSGYFCVSGRPFNGAGTDLPDLNYSGIASVLGAPPEPKIKKAAPLAAVVPPGSQEAAMFREAARLRRLGYAVDEITKMLWALVEGGRFPSETGREPWTIADCEAKARQVEKYEPSADIYHTTDDGCARFFRDTQGELAKFDADRKVWLLFDGVRWSTDYLTRIKVQIIESLHARQVIAIKSGADESRRKALVSAENKVPAILAAAVSYLSTRTTSYDLDPWLLGVPNGVVDLRTGELRGGTPEDRISMQTSVAFNPKAECPLWEKTVAAIFAKDGVERPEFVSYVQRALGYSITGDCREEVFFLCTGRLGDDDKNGRNGKGTLVNTVAKVLGDYAGDMGFASLEYHRGAQNGAGAASPDLAKLVHKRFVTASESNKGAHFNTARIKALTGRDTISARFLYGQEFSFTPELKMWLSVNHPPKVDDSSLGFWSRPHVVEYPNTFADKGDNTLKDRLLLEGEGILAWLVRGALEWQRIGLNPPKDVKNAVTMYQDSQGDLDDFLEARCVVGGDVKATQGELWDAYVRWTQVERRRKSGSIDFGKRLKKRFGEPVVRNFKQKTDGVWQVREYHGVGLRADTGGGMF